MRQKFNDRRDDFEYFVYGGTCETSPSAEYVNTIQNGKSNFNKFALKLKTTPTATPSVSIASVDRTSVFWGQGASKEHLKYRFPWNEEVKKVREYLGISHQELAEIVKTSKQTIINIENGATKEPQKSIADKVELLSEIVRVISSLRPNKMYQGRAFFNGVNSMLGKELSPIEHLKKGDEYALHDILGLALKLKN